MRPIPANVVHHSSRSLKKWDKLLTCYCRQGGSNALGGRGVPYLIEIQRKLQCQVTVSALALKHTAANPI